MKCPHCLVIFHPGSHSRAIVGSETVAEQVRFWKVSTSCPSCDRLIVWLSKSWGFDLINPPWPFEGQGEETEHILIWPKSTGRPPLPPEVPEEFAADYKEACLILADSPNASAALSRRGLQHLLREKAKVKHGTIKSEIDAVVNSGSLPSSIVEVIDIVRKVGNAAAHPWENQAGLIVPVERWEAEWSLEVLEALFDHYFITPARNAERLHRLNR